MYNIYMKFFKTLQAQPRAGEARVILVALALGFINLCGFELLVTLILNSIMTFFIHTMALARFNTKAGKKEFLKILTNY